MTPSLIMVIYVIKTKVNVCYSSVIKTSIETLWQSVLDLCFVIQLICISGGAIL